MMTKINTMKEEKIKTKLSTILGRQKVIRLRARQFLFFLAKKCHVQYIDILCSILESMQ